MEKRTMKYNEEFKDFLRKAAERIERLKNFLLSFANKEGNKEEIEEDDSEKIICVNCGKKINSDFKAIEIEVEKWRCLDCHLKKLKKIGKLKEN